MGATSSLERASSIGAEAFTIAMVMDQAIRSDYPRATYSILGTDISTDVLKQANRAIYPTEMVAPVPADIAPAIAWSRVIRRGRKFA